MSFLDSVLSSIQTGKPSQLPLSQAPASPAPVVTPKKEDRKPAVGRQAPPTSGNVSSGIKRKAEEQLPRLAKSESGPTSIKSTPAMRPAVSSPASKVGPKPATSTSTRPAPTKPTTKPSLSATTKAALGQKAPAKPAAAAPATSSKPPPPGSFAAIMAQAKAKQEQAPAYVGLLRHKPLPKERLTKVERKRRMMETQAKEREARLGRKAGPGITADKPGQRDAERPSYKGTAKMRTPEPLSYRGTLGLPSKRGADDRRQQSRNSRQNEYLATDEEDEGDYGGYDDGYSDASSDMEAGIDDVDREEEEALRFAKREDEEALREEMRLKKEKLERQRKLAALASRRR
ncbi:Chromatin SPT2 [Penicillium sp. DV-2018c]|nr:Chromatin SPT2 [Penicillium sp. DV-2018c]